MRHIQNMAKVMLVTGLIVFYGYATEAFFELPVALRAEHPELYEVLAAYFRQDPAEAETNSPPSGPLPTSSSRR